MLRASSRCSRWLERGLAPVEHLDQVHAEARRRPDRRTGRAAARSSLPRTRARTCPGWPSPGRRLAARWRPAEFSRASCSKSAWPACDPLLELGQLAGAPPPRLSCGDGRSRMWRAWRLGDVDAGHAALALFDHLETWKPAPERTSSLTPPSRQRLRRLDEERRIAVGGPQSDLPPVAAASRRLGKLPRQPGEILAGRGRAPSTRCALACSRRDRLVAFSGTAIRMWARLISRAGDGAALLLADVLVDLAGRSPSPGPRARGRAAA